MGGETLLAVLRALGEDIGAARDAEEALRAREGALERSALEPVAVAWDGAGTARLRRMSDEAADCTLVLEDGGERRWRAETSGGPEKAIPLEGLPSGYHRLRAKGADGECLVVSAPGRAFTAAGRRLGVFVPTHAIRRRGDLGVGDLTGLEEVAAWIRRLGADLVGTLPPLAAFLDDPFEPSPYAAVSRLYWNELLVDPARAPELKRSEEARRLLESAGGEAKSLRDLSTVDQRRAMALKRPILEALARASADGGSPEPDLDSYARFRAGCERFRAGWGGWPEPGVLPSELDPERLRYHRYVQRLAEAQLAQVGARIDLSLDLPLGVHPHGYDTWRERGLFADRISTGAPPDAFSLEGQDWGFPPVHPERSREQGHRYFIASVRTMLRHARALRVDHVMGLHRLFWIPAGRPPTEGAFVRYPRDELYAILCLESHRRGAILVGEDLGTVPREVRAELRRRGLLRMFVTQVEARPGQRPPVRKVPAQAQASLNTHDMFPFRAFWEGTDVERRIEVGILPPELAAEERTDREEARAALARHLRSLGLLETGDPTWEEALDAALAHLASSDAHLVLVSLEDLWGEAEPQNIPGTTTQHPNWRRRARHTVEEARMMEEFVGRLGSMAGLRRGATP